MRHQRRAGVISCVALLAILICGVFSPLGVGAAKTNDKIDSLNDKLDQLDDEKKELEENISTAKDQRASEIEKKENLDSEIANLEQQIATINELIVELDGEIATKDEQVAQLETDVYKRQLQAHIKVDTGMSRLGVLCQDTTEVPRAAAEILKICALPGLACGGIFTHFADASDASGIFTQMQYLSLIHI